MCVAVRNLWECVTSLKWCFLSHHYISLTLSLTDIIAFDIVCALLYYMICFYFFQKNYYNRTVSFVSGLLEGERSKWL